MLSLFICANSTLETDYMGYTVAKVLMESVFGCPTILKLVQPLHRLFVIYFHLTMLVKCLQSAPSGLL